MNSRIVHKDPRKNSQPQLSKSAVTITDNKAYL